MLILEVIRERSFTKTRFLGHMVHGEGFETFGVDDGKGRFDNGLSRFEGFFTGHSVWGNGWMIGEHVRLFYEDLSRNALSESAQANTMAT